MPRGIFNRTRSKIKPGVTLTAELRQARDLTAGELHVICFNWANEPHHGPDGEQVHWDATIGPPLIVHQKAIIGRVLLQHKKYFIIAEIEASFTPENVVKELNKWVKALVGL